MQLIGMLDSPFVRRVAIALRLLDLPYEHRPLSVFRNFEAFSLFNPMVKAPTLVLDDGTVLMDSSLILDYLECLAGRERSLLPQRPQARARALSLIGAALVACEKSVQIYYELNLRPEERRHGPGWSGWRGSCWRPTTGWRQRCARSRWHATAASSWSG